MNEIESRLSSLELTPPTINRDALLFEAGWAAAVADPAVAAGAAPAGPTLSSSPPTLPPTLRLRLWQVATCVSTAAMLLLLVRSALPPAENRSAALPSPQTAPTTSELTTPADEVVRQRDPPSPAPWPPQSLFVTAVSQPMPSLAGAALTPRGLTPAGSYVPDEIARFSSPRTSWNLLRELIDVRSPATEEENPGAGSDQRTSPEEEPVHPTAATQGTVA